MSVHERAIELQVTGKNDLLRVADELGFRKSYPLPFEKTRLVNEHGITLTIQFDGIIRLYGDGALEVAEHLLRAGSAT
jgi:hypothetical protein